jgi:hypothetical protein
MSLHLVKLCVGCESIAELEGWIAETSAERRRRKQVDEQVHTTRMMPKRVEDLLAGGSLYWVIKGMISCRQTILDLRQVTGSDGISRRAMRPFQGWRYLEEKSAPRDLKKVGKFSKDMPETMRRELAELGLL